MSFVDERRGGLGGRFVFPLIRFGRRPADRGEGFAFIILQSVGGEGREAVVAAVVARNEDFVVRAVAETLSCGELECPSAVAVSQEGMTLGVPGVEVPNEMQGVGVGREFLKEKAL